MCKAVFIVASLQMLATNSFAVLYYGDDSTTSRTYIQPDGYTQFSARFWGNSVIWEFETESGYTIAQRRSDYYWCYAVLDVEGYYIASNYRVGLDEPIGIPLHLRRSPTAQAELEAQLEESQANIELAYNEFIALPRPLQPFRIGVLFYEFNYASDTIPDLLHKNWQLPDSTFIRYRASDIYDMFISLNTYKGRRHNMNKQTAEHEEPFGSIRDYYLEVTNSDIVIDAGGPFNNNWLIINPINNDEIQWLQIDPTARGALWLSWYIVDRAIDAGWLPNSRVQGFDRLVLVCAGNNERGARGCNPSIVQIPPRADPQHRTGYWCFSVPELQGTIGYLDFMGGNRANLLGNIGIIVHELGHTFGQPDFTSPGFFDAMEGPWLAPMGERGREFGRGTCPTRFNPLALERNDWCQIVPILSDTQNIKIGYRRFLPTYFKYTYIDSNLENAFYLENRQMVDGPNQHVDFSSFCVGSWEWQADLPQFDLVNTGRKNNLLIWHFDSLRSAGYGRPSFHLELADGHDDAAWAMNGNDPYPGFANINEFGPGTGNSGPNLNNILLGSSHDIFNGNGNYRLHQTGFCIKNIVADDEIDSITCDIYTNYWGGETQEDLTLTGENIYLGQNCEIVDGGSITASGTNGHWMIKFDSNVIVSNGGILALNSAGPQMQTCHLYLNGHNLTINQGGSLTLGATQHNESIFIHGGGLLDLQALTIDDVKLHVRAEDDPWQIHMRGNIVIQSGGSLSLEYRLQGPPCVLNMHGHDIVVHAGGRFTMNEGDEVGRIRILNPGRIWFNGQIGIIGNPEEPHEFTIEAPNPSPGDWTGIEFEDLTESCTLQNVVVSYAVNGIKAEDCGSNLTLDNVTISDFRSTGIYLVNTHAVISNCSASGSPTNGSLQPVGLYIYESKPTVTYSTFDENAMGIEVAGPSGILSLGHTSASNNDGAGITFYSGMGHLYYSSYYTNLGYNHFIGNGANAGVYKAGTSYPYLSSGSSGQGLNSIYSNYPYEVKNTTTIEIPAEYNWWNDILGPSSIYGLVDYDPWLMSDPDASPAPPRLEDKDKGGCIVADVLDAAFYNADGLFADGEFDRALQVYNRIVSSNPADRRTPRAFGQIYGCLLNLDRGDEWREAIAGIAGTEGLAAGNRLAAQRLLVHAEQRRGEDRAARSIIDDLLRNIRNDDQERPYLLFELGMLQHYGQRDLEGAISTFEGIIENYDEHPIYGLAIRELAECNRENNDIDSPPAPREGEQRIPDRFELFGCYPNPFNSQVQIKYVLPDQMNVRVTVHDASGRELVCLFDGVEQAGIRSLAWTVKDAPAGIYFCKVAAGSNVATTKVTLVK